jgi:hypothetical protein
MEVRYIFFFLFLLRPKGTKALKLLRPSAVKSSMNLAEIRD